MSGQQTRERYPGPIVMRTASATVGRVLLGVAAALVEGEIVEGDVRLHGDRIGEVGVRHEGFERIASTGSLAVPGFVDLQVNGFAGVDLRSADNAGYATVASALAQRGVTAFCPTFHSQSLDDHLRCLDRLAQVHADRPAGATVLGAHMEGPFLSPSWSGAHDHAHLLEPDRRVLDRLLDADHMAMMTIAPELARAMDAIDMLVDEGVVVAIGHTDATAAQTVAAVDAGARHLTHCWNAHRRFAPRDPGPAGAALADSRIAVGLIGDLVHVAPEVVSLTLAAARGRVAATTDAVTAAGESSTRSTSGGRTGRVATTPQGTIAGGLAGMDDVLRNLAGLGIDVATVVDACGGVQRDVLGLPQVRMAPGDPADIAVLSSSLDVLCTYVAGRPVHGPT